MNQLVPIIEAHIKQNGPMSIADYMSMCLFEPQHGYYTTRDPFGAEGDFTTAPEISQMFGELIALSLAQTWMDQGQPNRVALVELGPGRGTLMADVLRTLRAVPDFLNACSIHLIEASPRMRGLQKETLSGFEPIWHDAVETLPQDLPIYAVANEFFDALPIRQMVRDGDAWRERQVGVKDDALAFGLSEPYALGALQHRLEDTRDGDLVEFCSAAPHILRSLGEAIERNGGAALVFDYGDWRSLGDTLQALKAHEPVDVLHEPGQCDLTAHVDFEALIQNLPCTHSKVTPQGIFLERLGITQRAQALAAKLSDRALDQHIAAHRRLTHPEEMGNLFKTIALFPSSANPPPGYET